MERDYQPSNSLRLRPCPLPPSAHPDGHWSLSDDLAAAVLAQRPAAPGEAPDEGDPLSFLTAAELRDAVPQALRKACEAAGSPAEDVWATLLAISVLEKARLFSLCLSLLRFAATTSATSHQPGCDPPAHGVLAC